MAGFDAEEIPSDASGRVDLEALRERLHKDLVERREKAADDELRKSVMDSLIEQTEFQVPPGLVDGRLS